jgi:glyoxylase-like metal-dependent hydrolase (beta-lactamase superfamily II)
MSNSDTAPTGSELAFNREMNFEYGVLSELAPGVRRIVANNPGDFTFMGTNTYVVGEGEVAVIDPGPDDGAHVDALLAALGSERVTHILVTHTHHDHTGAVPALKARTGAPVLAFGATGGERGVRTTSPSGKAFVDEDLVPDTRVRDGDTIAGSGWKLDAIHTPGHAPDHLCFALSGARTLFSGDHVMGWNTTVVAPPEGHMGDYLSSLERLLERRDKVFFPGHGGRIETPQRVVKAYIMHRQMRESAILASLREGACFIPQIVERIYPNLETSRRPAAALSVLAHLELLHEKGKVRTDGPLAPHHGARGGNQTFIEVPGRRTPGYQFASSGGFAAGYRSRAAGRNAISFVRAAPTAEGGGGTFGVGGGRTPTGKRS